MRVQTQCASIPFYTIGSMPCMVLLALLCSFIYLQDGVPYQYPGSFSTSHFIVSSPCLLSPYRWPFGWFPVFCSYRERCGVGPAFDHACKCNFRRGRVLGMESLGQRKHALKCHWRCYKLMATSNREANYDSVSLLWPP